jgi:hypothetical protein
MNEVELKTFKQGDLDFLCGIYSIINADKIINDSTPEESHQLFKDIIHHLAKRRILKKVIIEEGITHRQVTDIMDKVIADRIPFCATNKRGLYELGEWWEESKLFLKLDKRVIILSLGGIDSHLTVLYKMTNKNLFLMDSNVGNCKLHRSFVDIVGSAGNDKHLIYPAQCWYLGKE